MSDSKLDFEKMPLWYYVVMYPSYNKAKSVDGIVVKCISPENVPLLEAMTSEEEKDLLLDKSETTIFGKASLKSMNGRAGSIYACSTIIQIAKGKDTGSVRSIYPHTSNFKGRLNTPLTRNWDLKTTELKDEASLIRLEKKESKVKLLEETTLKELREYYKSTYSTSKSIFISRVLSFIMR